MECDEAPGRLFVHSNPEVKLPDRRGYIRRRLQCCFKLFGVNVMHVHNRSYAMQEHITGPAHTDGSNICQGTGKLLHHDQWGRPRLKLAVVV